MAEEIVASGRADMVAMTRTQIADPEFANKAREGREDEIYHCIRGNQGCIGRVFKGMAISCTVNPAAGREARFGIGTLTPAESQARWLVVGGGPAGMKAAETLAKRGHRVTLIEREAELGGQVNLILRTPGRETFAWITQDLDRHMRKAGVDIRLGVEATAETVAEIGADGVVVATGAVPVAHAASRSSTRSSMSCPGVGQENVVHAWDVLTEEPRGRQARRRPRRRRQPVRGGCLRGAARPRRRGRSGEPVQRAVPIDDVRPRSAHPLQPADDARGSSIGSTTGRNRSTETR